MKTINFQTNLTLRKNIFSGGLRAVLMVLLMFFGVGEMWAGGTHYVSATTADPAQGLVYLSTSNQSSVANSSFKNSQPGGLLVSTASSNNSTTNACYIDAGDDGCTPTNQYYWARPSRGYVFNGSWGKRGDSGGTGQYPDHPASATGGCNTADELNQGPWDGDADCIQSTAGGSQATWRRPTAYFSPATKYVITYAVPVGGSYSVQYEYITSYNTGSTESDGTAIWKFKDDGFDFSMTTSTEEAREENSYAADKITLSVPSDASSFLGWYENGSLISGTGPTTKTYVYTAHTNATISPLFKEIGWGEASGDLAVNVGTGSEAELDTYSGKKVYVACPTLIGPWTSSDFTITTTALSNSYGSIALGTATLDAVNNRLEIPYSFTATHWGGISVEVTVTPAYGEPTQFTIACSSEEVVGYEACIEESGVRTHTGTLGEMMTQANSMDNKPTVKLMNNGVTITTPVSFTKSMTFDVNGKVLTANCASAFSIDAAGIDVQIMDGSFTQVGEIHTAYASSSAVSVVTFTKAAKLTMNGGTLSAANTGAGAAYGVDVQQGSIFFLTNGDLTVSANSGSAQGVHVASASDYATLNGGSISVLAPTNAYGLWSAGQSNITDVDVTVETSTGTNAYGVYVNGGISTVTTTDFAVSAHTSNAYGAYVNAGRLNFNGGKLAVEAVADKVYGVYVASGATAMLQQNTKVSAEVSTGNGTNNVEVCGIHNLGTASMNNITVTATNMSTTATASTNYAAAISTNAGAVSTTIEDGTYTANAETGYAYAIRHRKGMLTVDGGTFKGILKTSGVGAFGAHVSDNATIANATLYGETKGTGSKAHGVVGNAGTVTLTNCDITGKSNTNIAYAIYSRTNLTATGCTLTATTSGTDQAYGLYAEDGTNSLTNCNATVTAQTVKAYGVNHVAGSVTINGGSYTVDAKQGAATAAQNSELYGLYNAASKTTSVTNATFTVIASNAAYSQNVYGACINGTLNSTGATYTAQAKLSVFGVWGNTASTLTLSNNTISSTATNGATSYGVYAKKNFTIDGDIVSAQATTTGVYAMFFDATSVGEVRGGKFKATGNGTTTYGPLNATATAANVKLKGGVYDSNTNLDKYKFTGYNIYTIDDTEADYAAGYYYVIATENPSPYVCKIVGGAHYTTLEAALQYTKDNAGSNHVIVMTQNYTLPAGDYELPSNATLLIPHLVGQNAIYADGGNDNKNKTTTSKDIVEFMRLTLAANAKLSVSGKIEVSAQMWCAETGHISYIKGPYARIYMNSGSLIQLNSGAVLYAWGKITGTGEIKVKNNAEVREMFQIYGMPAMSNIVNVYNNNNYKFFPVQQYEINNIEVPATYYYGSRLVCAMSNYYKGVVGIGYNKDDNIKVIGTSGALFLVDDPDESSWVRKSYASSYQIWEANSNAKLGSLKIVMEEATMNSANYILPITTNMKIHILDGDFAITQSTQLLPGSQLEINKTGKLTINSGCSLYVFDKDQSTFTSYADAAVNVHGKIDVKGSLFTTKSIANGTNATNGANIYSNDADAGTITYNANAASATNIQLITGVSSGSATTRQVDMEPAKLKNGDGTYKETASTNSGEAWIYLDGEWKKTYTNGCFEVIEPKVYAKPSGFVELKKSQTDANSKLTGVEEANHTYLTASDKLLILMDECQWWEVVATSDPAVFKCEKPGYEGFYYYDETAGKWKLKTVNVTFYMKEEGSDANDKVIVTDYNGIPDQAVIATNPTKETTSAATYTFYGWKSSVSDTTYHWDATLETATADMSYRPVFTANPRHYTVTFADANNGANVPVEVAYGEHPAYTAVKDPAAQYTYYFQYWLADDAVSQFDKDAELPAVTRHTTYTAVWSNIVNKYPVVWKNGETIIETDAKQAYGAAVSYDGATPTKEADNNFAYTFDGWALTDGGAKLSPMPTVNGEMTFYAHYSTTPRYKVTFANYDGTSLQQEQVTQGEHPIYNGLTPGRARDLDGYYYFTGWKNGNGDFYASGATLPAVTGKETFTAQYNYVNELYLITLNNVDGAGASWSGKFGVGSTPFYNRDNNDVAVEPAKASTVQYEYTFSGWDPALVPVDGEATYTAQFAQNTRNYNITFANLDGNGASQTIEVEYGTTPVSPVAPEKATATHTYEFLGWDNTLVPVTGEATYTAQFSATGTPREFPITFDPDNGVDDPVVINVAYGQTPAYPYAAPTKASDAANNYTFSGWTPAVTTVTGPAEYTAQYTPTVRTFTITFKNYDGSTIKEFVLPYGATPSISNPSRPIDLANKKAYTFTGWSPAIATVTANATYTATYSEVSFVASVTPAGGEPEYKNSLANAITAANSSAGSVLKLYSNVTGTNNTTISGNFTIDLNGCTISLTTSTTSNTRLFYVTGSLTVMDSGEGGKISYSGSGNAHYYTIYSQNSTSVITINGGIIEAKKTGGSSSRNAAPLYMNYGDAYINGGELIASSTKNAYAVYDYSEDVVITGGKFYAKGSNTTKLFSNGSKTQVSGGYFYTNDFNSATVVSGYEKREMSAEEKAANPNYNYKVVQVYTVTFRNEDGTQLQSKTEEVGTTPVYSGTPTKAATAQYTYTHSGWTPEIVPVTGEATYTATYSSTINKYTITWLDGDGNELTSEQVEYGKTPSYSGSTPTKAADVQYTYTHNGWTPEIVSVTGNATYNATFSSTVNKYTITFKNGDEVLQSGEVDYGETPAYAGAAPTKVATAQYTYTFNGWDPEISTVTGAQTYTALYTETANTYTVIWQNTNGNILEKDENVPYGTAPSYDGETPEHPDFVTRLDYYRPFTGWSPEVVEVTENATYTATYGNETPRQYTVSWMDYNGNILFSKQKGWGWSIPASDYEGEKPHRDAEGNKIYNFIGWSEPVSEVNGCDVTYTAQYELTINTTSQSGTDPIEIPINNDESVEVTVVPVSGSMNVASNATLTTNDLILEATPSSSGEITGEGTVNTTNAYFHFSQEGGFKARTWYAVAVPWQVNVPAYELGGVYLKKGDGEFVQQTLGSTFDLIYYDGYRRSQGATKAWNYVEEDDDDKQIMYPGRAYMIYLTSDADTIRFAKDNEKLIYTEVPVAQYSSDNASLANWNGIANPAIYRAYLNVGATEGRGQVYNPDSKGYEWFNMSENKLQVGQPIFVQSAKEGSIVANSETYDNSSAPALRRVVENRLFTRYELMLAASYQDVSDRIIVRMDEDKETDAYIVGQDLAKMGVSSVVPQMWVDRYDSKMSINTVAPNDNTADYPLGIFAPHTGEYEIFIEDQPDSESMLYLTYDGEAIWNLCYGGYVLNLEKGTDAHYGLRIISKKSPQVTTGMDEAVVDAQGETRKVLINDHVYIIRGGEVYSVDGQLVK